MKKNGFTLIELLAVLAILATILGLIIVNAKYYSDQRREKDYNNIRELAEKNTDTLVNTDDEFLEKLENKTNCKVDYSELVDRGLMDKDTKNPITNELLYGNSYVEVNCNDEDCKSTFKYKDDTDYSTSIINCTSDQSQIDDN